jgi:predicted ribosomally synthesized peptide with nif11-like leader
MSEASVQAFFEKVRDDEDFSKRLSEAASKEDRWAIIEAEGFEFTKEEFESHRASLSDEELSQVVGGKSQSIPCIPPGTEWDCICSLVKWAH